MSVAVEQREGQEDKLVNRLHGEAGDDERHQNLRFMRRRSGVAAAIHSGPWF